MLRRLSRQAPMGAWNLRYATIIPVPMPALSPTMTQGTITEWKKKVGDSIAPGQQFCTVETDKAAVAFNNTSEEGFIARILADPSSGPIPIGKIIALLVEEKADIASEEVKNWKDASAGTAPAAPPTPAPSASAPASSSAPQTNSAPAANQAQGGRVLASPLAKVTAKELGVDLSKVRGTGGDIGRVTKDDVIKFQATAPPVPAASTASAAQSSASPATAPIPLGSTQNYTDIPLTGMRRTIAARLTQAKNVDIPHYYETITCQVDNMMDLIKHLNKKGDGKYKITVNDFLIKAIARANLIVPQCNTHWAGDYLRQYHQVDVSVAVATPTGLITPIVRDAHVKGLVAISEEVKALAKKAKAGELQPQEYQGGTVTISNLGGMGIDQFTAIINPPQSMILAVGTVRPQPELSIDSEGEYVATGKIQRVMTFTASFDHRVVDGAVGAEWFKHFRDTIENPLSLLL